MKSLFFLIIAAFIPLAAQAQDIQLGGSDLNGSDVLDWNTYPIALTAPSANMILNDSFVVKSNYDKTAFYPETAKILKSGGFEIESGFENSGTGLKAQKTIGNHHFEIVITYFPLKFRSSTIMNKARVMFYSSVSKSEILAGDLKSFEKTKLELDKQLKNAPKQGHVVTYTADEQRVVNQLSRRAIPAINLIDGTNTLQMVADKAKMQNEEVAQIFAFMIEKGFAHVAK